MRLIDLSVIVENSPSEPMTIKIKRYDWYNGAKKFCRTILWNKYLPLYVRLKHFFAYFFKGRNIFPSDFPNKAFISLDVVTLPSHMGTHIDAPYHFGPSTAHDCKTIDQLPIDWFFKPAVRLDLRHKKPGEEITVNDIKEALVSVQYSLQPLDIVLIWTGCDKLWGKKEYFSKTPGMSRHATEWLINQEIKVIGIDTYSFDRSFEIMLNDFWKTKNKAHLWPAHFYGREKEYVHIERLTNLEQLPNHGFYMACLPLKIKGLDASWVRAVGIIL